MKKLLFFVADSRGLHARPACLLVSTSKKFVSAVTLRCKTGTANAKELFELLDLQVSPSTELWLEINGTDEEEAFKALKTLILNNLSDTFE